MARAAFSYPTVIGFAGLLSLTSGCVIGRSTRPTVVESAQGPLALPVAGAPVVPATLAENSDAPSDKAKSGAVWVQGYWHWDGVKYVWQRGHWENAASQSR